VSWSQLRGRMALASIALILATLVAVTIAIQAVVRDSVLEREYALREASVGVLYAQLEAHVRGVRQEVLALSTQPAAVNILLRVPGADAHRLERQYATLLRANRAYRQCRIIDQRGLEVLRVDRGPDGGVRRVSAEDLQNKRDRDYVLRTLALSPGEVYFGRIDLNRERGQVERPQWAVLRVAAPITEPGTERVVGMVIINVDMSEAFESLRNSALPGERVFLANEEGDFLVHPDRAREFGFEFGRSYRVRAEFYEAVETHEVVRVEERDFYLASQGGRLAGGPSVTLFVGYPQGALLASVGEVFRTAALTAIPVMLLGIGASFLIARTLTRPIEQLTEATRSYSHETEFRAPRGGSVEVRVLSHAIETLLEEMNAKTEALESEVATRQKEETRFRGTVEAVPTGILMADASGAIQLINAEVERLFGYPREELIGKPVETLLPEALREAHASYRGTYTKNPERRSMGRGRDLFGAHKNGGRIPVEIGLSPLETPDGTVYLATIVDITERHSAQARLKAYAQSLEQSNSDLERFAYVVSHDLKSPLRGMANVAAWLRDDIGEQVDDDARENLDLMIDRAERLTQLIDGILQYSRVSRHKAEPVRVDVGAMVREIIGSLDIPEGVSVRAEGELPEIVYDETQLGQVFQNLIDNAVRHLERDDGEVVVSAKRLPGAWRFSVRDNGPGIDERHFERIFGMFQTLSPKNTRRSTGIGLSIVKRIVERNGGEVDVNSEVGTGAEFTFTTPAASL